MTSRKVMSLLLGAQVAAAEQATPISKVTQLLTDLTQKVTKEGEAAQKTYNELTDFCEERSANLAYQIKTAKGEKASLDAAVAEEGALIGSLTEKVGDLAASISSDDADLQAASKMRAKEAADFAREEKELMATIDTLQRAVGILEQHASMLQTKNAGTIAQAMKALVDASELSSADASHLTALVQNAQSAQSDDEDSSLGAPDPTTYEGHSSDIVDTLSNLLDKAQDQLSSIRNAETSSLHNYDLVKQSLTDGIKVSNKDMAAAKKSKAESSQKKATAEGDLAQTVKSLKSDTDALADLHSDCMTRAEDYEAESKSRNEELKALAEATQVITSSTEGAAGISYGLAQVSFLQRTASESKNSKFAVVHYVRDLAKKEQSQALAQLASRMANVIQAKMNAGQDPFAKVKGLITTMIEKLEDDADADASHKAYCDKELGESKGKKEDKASEIEKLSTKIDGMVSRSSQLKAEVAGLQKALAELASAQLEMDKLRKEENDAFVSGKKDMEQGIEGVQLGIKILTEYYAKDDKAHSAAEGAGAGIIGLLQVVESDFSTGLAEMTSTEEAAAAAYTKETNENKIEKAAKDQDVKYKSEEVTSLSQAVAEASSDRDGAQTELDAVNEYLAKLEKICVAKAETHGERKARYAAELAGLKEALNILDGEAVLLQQSSKRSLRAVRTHGM